MYGHTPPHRRDLYPTLEVRHSEMLKVSPLHTIYVEESGNAFGRPVVALHGGPGGGLSPEMRRFFDPARYRIVIYDQRGAGRSRPLGELAMPADEVRVQVRLDHIPDAQPPLFGLIQILLHIALRIDDHGLAVRADEIGGMREAAEVEVTEMHRVDGTSV